MKTILQAFYGRRKKAVGSVFLPLALTGCVLSDGSELIPKDISSLTQGMNIHVSAGLQPDYTWDLNGNPILITNITVVDLSDASCTGSGNTIQCQPVWGIQVGGGNGDLIPSPQKHGNKPQGIGTLLGTENHVLTAGKKYRAHIYRANGTDKFVDFVAGIGVASLTLPAATQNSGVTSRSVAVTAGGSHSVTVKDDGTVWTWGANYNGQLGNGLTMDSAVPQQVPGLAGIVAVAAGEAHTLALTATGTVWAWGDNSHGQLGTGSTINSLVPIQIPGLYDVTSISAGRLHSMAVKKDGSVWAWGANYNGQLGDGTVANSSVPVPALLP